MKNIIKSMLVFACGLAVMTSCEDDRDSNPTLDTTKTLALELNPVEFANNVVVFSETDKLNLSWKQPSWTDMAAPLGQSGIYGLSYAVQLSKDGNYTKSFKEALAEVTLEDGTYSGPATGHNYTTLSTIYSGSSAELLCDEMNLAMNELNVFADESEVPEVVSAYLRVVAQLVKTDGKTVDLAVSEPVQVKGQIAYVDVMAVPAKVSYLWMPGNGNGWSHDNCPLLKSEDGEIYQGYAYMDGDFKFTLEAAWTAELNNGSFTSAGDGIDLGDGAGGNIGFTGEAGMYWLIVNPGAGEISATPVKWGIVGGFNSWSVDDGKIVDMTYNKDKHALEAEVEFETDTEWKFARDNSWDVNFGGSLEALEQDGSNFAGAAGKHTVRLYIERSDVEPHATVD